MSKLSVPTGFLRAICAATLGLLISASVAAFGESATPVVVELFTSEGCSDCPPADVFLRTLDSTQPVPGVQLIVLSEHVDYWDDQGWRDPFSSHAFSVRQGSYAQRLRLASPYTPQMVVDGSFEFVGSNRGRANQAFERARALPKIAVRISSVKIENGHLSAHVETDPVPSNAEVFIALALEHAESQVLRGENGGHHLEHIAVVKNLTSIGKSAKGQPLSKDIVLRTNSAESSYRVIAFVQEPNQGRILGASVERIQQ
jgi:hypothetical protein